MRVGVAVWALALLLAGCGGVESEPNLAKAVERTEATGSSRFEVRGVEGEGADASAIDCDGEADYADKRIRVRCDYGAPGELEMLAIRDAVYLRGGERLGLAGAGDKWIRVQGDTDDTSLQNFSPEQLLSMLRGASRGTERMGEEDIRDTVTTRYRLTVDCNEAELDCAGTAPVDIWIDRDGLVQRIDLDGETAEWTFEFFDFGVDVDIEPPPADQVTDESGLGSGGITVEPATACHDEEAGPISESQAIDALRRHGFSMGEGTCGPPPVLMTLSNNQSADRAKVMAREGLVICLLLAKPQADGSRSGVTGDTAAANAERRLANLKCTLYSDKAPVRAKADRLDRAFAELERAIRP